MRNRLAQSFRANPWANTLTGLLFALGAAQLVACAWFLRNSTSPDYATVVLMARHMAAGKGIPVFFYGQAYMGSLEPAASALLCWLFGPSPFNVCLGTVFFGLLLLLLTAWACRRVAGPWGGVFALVFLETTGYTWHFFLASPHGGYSLCCLLAFAALVLPVLARYPERGSGDPLPLAPTALFGFLAGLAFWNNWLAAPAFVAGGLALLFRLRARVLSPRFLLPFALLFLVGSLPWWLWSVRNGWETLSMQAGGARPPGLSGMIQMLQLEIPRYWGSDKDVSAFWKGPVPWVSALVVMAGAAGLALRRDRLQRRFVAVFAFFLLLFFFIYSRSSFGAVNTPRYLVPLAAPCAALAGAGAAAIAAARPRTRRLQIALASAAVLLVVVRLGLVAPAALRAGVVRLPAMDARGKAALAMWKAVASDPDLQGRPGYANFVDFGGNWMSDESISLVSAKLWRYRPYLDALEASDEPWVCDRYSLVENFVRASGGSCRVRAVGRKRVVDQLRPPDPVEEIPPKPAWAVQDQAGRDVTARVFGNDWAHETTLRGDAQGHCHVDVVLPGPVKVAGVRAFVDGEYTARFWSVDEVKPDGRCSMLAEATPVQGWFWSGPRPYQFGPGERWEMRWAPREVTRMRISFASRVPNYPVRIHGLRLLSDNPLPACEADVVCKAADAVRSSKPTPVAIYADRWLGRRLGAAPDPSLTAGSGAGNVAREPSFSYSTVDFTRPSLVVVPAGETARRAEGVLDFAGASYQRIDAGGAALFHVPAQTDTNASLRAFLSSGLVRFLGGQLWRETRVGDPAQRDASAIATLGGGFFDLLSAAPAASQAKPGEAIPFLLDWRVGAGRTSRSPVRVFVHGMRDGRIAFQGQTLLFPDTVSGPPNLPRLAHDEITLPLPADLPPGEYTFRIGFSPGAYSRRRFSVKTELPTRWRAISLPATLRVVPATP